MCETYILTFNHLNILKTHFKFKFKFKIKRAIIYSNLISIYFDLLKYFKDNFNKP